MTETAIISLSPADAAEYPRPGMVVPGVITFSPDDRWITYLYSPDNSLYRHLYAYNLQTAEYRCIYTAKGGGETEETLSAEEKLRRERARNRALGVTHYAWMPGAPPDTIRIMIPLNGSVTVLDDFSAEPRLVVSNANGPVLDPQWSPDGRFIAFVRDAELFVANALSGKQQQLTSGARETGLVHGLAEYIAQEEMGRQHGFWWSPDSHRIAYTEVDETHIPVYRIVHQGQELTGEYAQEDHLYPFAGHENAKVRLGVINVEGGDPVWMALGDDPDIYLARVQWWPDGSLVVQVENRTQTALQVLNCNPETGRCRVLLKETNALWINLHTMLKPLRDGRFIWASERSGFMHLYLFDQAGKLIHPLTTGSWVVDAIVGVDEDRNLVYFMGTYDSVLERHLYAVPLSGGLPRRLTYGSGSHEVKLDHAKSVFPGHIQHARATTAESRCIPLMMTPQSTEVFVQQLPIGIASQLQTPEYVEILSPDGLILHGMLYRPPATYGDGPYPTIVSVYGGPHVQQVTRAWSATVDMRAQYLSRLGYLVFKLDNRGSARRGQVFEGAIKHNMGDIEVQDQVTGVRWLVAQGLTDPSRVGIYGWSYGGYMALMCLARAPKVFRVAVAGAPVTHWDGYDTHYTERYMGTPQANPDGYRNSSVMAHVGAIEGKLLLIHGLIDENVHFRHTARLVNALISAGKPYDLLLFPDERHMPRRLEDRIYLEKRVGDYFQNNL